MVRKDVILALSIAMAIACGACTQDSSKATEFSLRKTTEIIVGDAILDVTAISDDGRYVAYNQRNNLVQIFNTRTGQTVSSFKVSVTPKYHVKALRFSPDGTQIAVIDWESSGQVRDVKTGAKQFNMTETERRERYHRSGSGGEVAFSPDGKIVYSDLAKSGVESYRTSTGQRYRYFLKELTASSKSLGVSSNGLYMAKAPTLGRIELWYLPNNKLVDTSDLYRGWEDRYTSILEFSPDGNLLAEGSVEECTVNVWRLDRENTPKLVQRIGRNSPITGLEWSADSRKLLVGETSNPPSLWNIELGTTLRIFEPQVSGREDSMSISRNGIIAMKGPDKLLTKEKYEEEKKTSRGIYQSARNWKERAQIW